MSKPNFRLSGSSLGLSLLLLVIGVAATAAGTDGASNGALIAQGIAPQQRVVLSGNTSHKLTHGDDLGALGADETVEGMLLQLKRSPARESALRATIDALHDPQSPQYHHWLTNAELAGDFGPASQDIATVTSWLGSNGFRVRGVSANGLQITFDGTAAQVQQAFSTTLHRYKVKGQQYLSNDSDPSIPAALAPVVEGIVSLNTLFPQPQLHAAVAPATPTKAVPAWNPEFTIGSSTRYLVAPYDFNTIYNVGPVWSAGVTGAGQTIAVIENTNILNTADVTTFRDAFGIGAAAGFKGTFAQIHPAGSTACKDPGVTANEREAALDAEWAGVAAPDAAIEVASCQDTGATFGGLIAANNLIGSANPPKIISVSYGLCESQNGAAANAAYVSAWQTAAAKGISVFVAAGDEGATSCDADADYAGLGISVSGFASTPYNVAVGGTDFRDTVDASNATYWNTSNGAGRATAKSYVPEIPWNNSCASSTLYTFKGYSDGVTYCNTSAAYNSGYVTTNAGSGGASTYSSRPSWQAGVLGLASDGKRDLPDVSLFAANGLYGHALLFCMSDTANQGVTCDFSNTSDALHSVGGGTSFAAPALAGIQALINQATGESWGNMNTRFYALAAQQYGSTASPNSSSVSACNANKGNGMGGNCVFNDITSGDIALPCVYGSVNCFSNYSGANNANCNDASTTAAKANTCGVISTSSSALQPAFAATPGWDFATGLGSVNVANLVSAMLPPASANKLKFSVEPASGNAGTALASIKVTIETSAGYPVSGSAATVTLALGSNSTGASLSGTLSATSVNGVATFNDVILDRSGSGYTLLASAANLSSDTSSAFNIGAGNPARLVFLHQPSTARAGSAIAPAISVQVQDALGNSVSSSAAVTLALANNPSGATLSGGSASASNGVATFSAMALDKVGSGYTLVASSAGLTSVISAAFSITPGAADHLAYAAQPPASTSAGSTFSVTLSVLDAHGNVATDSNPNITLSLDGSAGPASRLSAPAGNTHAASNGVITFDNLSVNKSSSGYRLLAAADSLGSAASDPFIIVAGTPTTLVYSAAPVAVRAGESFALSVSIQDVQGNLVTTANSSVSLTLANAGGATLGGALTVAAANGVANFNGLSLDKSGSYSVSASDDNMTLATTGISVSAGSASRLAFTLQPASQVAGGALSASLEVLDASGNRALADSSSITLMLGNHADSASLGGTVTATVVNGVAHFDDLSITSAASAYTLTAIDGGLGAIASTAFDISAATTSQLVFVTPPQSVVQDHALGSISLALMDQYGNVASSDNSTMLSVSVASCGGVELGTQAVSGGIATLTLSTPLRTLAQGLTLTAVDAADSLSTQSPVFDVQANPDRVFLQSFESCTL